MKRLLRAIKSLARSDFADRGDTMRAESRAEVEQMCAEGKAWDGIRHNARQIGMQCNESRGGGLRVVFGSGR